MNSVDPLSDEAFRRQVQRAVNTLRDAPQALQRAAIGLWPQMATATAPSPGAALASATQALAQQAVRAALRQIAAVLSFDSWSSSGLAHGMRAVRSPIRHLLYTAQGRDIDLRLSPASGDFSLAGQILGPDESGTIELCSESALGITSHVTGLDALGEFRIDGVRRGTYVMRLRMGDDEILLPPLKVGEPL